MKRAKTNKNRGGKRKLLKNKYSKGNSEIQTKFNLNRNKTIQKDIKMLREKQYNNLKCKEEKEEKIINKIYEENKRYTKRKNMK